MQDRVKQALKQQEVSQQENRRKRRISVKGNTEEETDQVEEKIEKEVKNEKKEKDEKPKAKRKCMPPPIDFSELLKIAEKKQHEPIVINVQKSKNDEPERLMTKKQMKEYAKEKEWRERKEQRNKLGNVNNKEGNVVSTTNKTNKTQDCRNTANCSNKIPKVPEKLTTVPAAVSNNKIPSKATGLQCSTSKKLIIDKANPNKVTTSKSEKDILLEERKKLETERKKLEEMRQAIEEEKKKLRITKTQTEDMKNPKTEKSMSKVKTWEKQDLLKNIHKESPTTNATKSRIPQRINDKIKQFPPPDLKPIKSRHIPQSKEQKKPLINNKRKKFLHFFLLNYKLEKIINYRTRVNIVIIENFFSNLISFF